MVGIAKGTSLEQLTVYIHRKNRILQEMIRHWQFFALNFLASSPLKRSYFFHQRGQKIFLWLAVPMPVLTRGKFYMRVVTAYYVEFSCTKERISSFLKFYNANYVY